VRERSTFAELSPSTITDGTIFVALKCYFDGSGTTDQTLTLAAIAGDEQVWKALEADWLVLLGRVGATYMHMREAMARVDGFERISTDERDWLVNALLTVVDQYQKDSGRLTLYTCAVDLVAHAEYAAKIPTLPSPARMCVRSLFPKIYDWYAKFPEPILDVIEMYFDRNEKFMEHLDADWRDKEFCRQHPAWDLVRTIAPVKMKETPGVQVADLFAWARNRVEMNTGDKWYAIARLILHAAPDHHFSFDRQKISTYPPYAIM